MRGQEAEFARRLEKLLNEKLLKGPFGKAYKVGVGKNLLYTLEIDAAGKSGQIPRNGAIPSAGSYTPSKPTY